MKQGIKLLRLTAATCQIMTDAGITNTADGHPNKLIFTGTLLLLDQPSNRAPNGSEGHRIMVPSSVAENRLQTLIGMGVNYDPYLDTHAPRRKVGVITKAWIEGKALKVRGLIWKKDFPEAIDDIKGKPLGMSMELADILIRDKNETVWYLTDFYFTGATILWPESAAYQSTTLAASAAKAGTEGVRAMANKTTAARKKTAGSDVLTQLQASIGIAVGESMKPFQDGLAAQTAVLQQIAEALGGRQSVIDAGADGGDDEITELEDLLTMDAAADDSESDDENEEDDEEVLDAGADDEDDMEADSSGGHPKPGYLNKGAHSKGRKTTVTAAEIPPQFMKKKKVNAAADRSRTLVIQAASEIKTLRASLAKSNRASTALSNKVEAMEAQIENFSRRVERKSLSASAMTLLERAGADVRELMASAGAKTLSTSQVDGLFEKAGMSNLDPTMRMALKNELLQAGIMDQGVIRRVNVN